MLRDAFRNNPIESIVLTTLILFGAIVSFFALKQDPAQTVLGEDVTVTATVMMRPHVHVKPEKRIPPSNNDSVSFNLLIRPIGSTTVLDSQDLVSDAIGRANLNDLDPAIIPPGDYDVAVKGLSHLRKVYTAIPFGPTVEFSIDLTSDVLPAGDTHPTSDNFINSLDFSYSIMNLYTSEIRADLNRDSKVNSLDFATQISHIYERGEE